MKNVEIYTDGACSGNPGPGGIGVVLRANGVEKEISQGYRHTTNNRMELRAVITGLETLKYPCNVKLYTDSKYVADSLVKGWVKNWQSNGWKKADKKPALNVDLWKRLLELIEIHNVEIIWVKGHNNNTYNERCDKLAVAAYNSDTLIEEDA